MKHLLNNKYNIYKNDNELLDYINSLEENKKNLAILSLFLKNSVWCEINDNINVYTNIKIRDILLNEISFKNEIIDIKEYEICEFIINSINVNWDNPNLKILLPFASSGLAISLVNKLMNDMISIPIENRYRHILENMITITSSNEYDLNITKFLLDYNDEYDININNDNFNSFITKNNILYDLVICSPKFIDYINGKLCITYPNISNTIFNISKISCLVLPTKWFTPNRNTYKFLYDIKNSGKIEFIYDFGRNSDKIFTNSIVDGGLCVLIKNDSYNSSVCNFNNENYDLSIGDSIVRPSKYSHLITYLEKVKSISTFLKGRGDSTFGIESNDSRIVDKSDNTKLVYFSKKKGFIKYINSDDIKIHPFMNCYKVFTAECNGTNKLGNIFIGKPDEFCSGSYIWFAVDSEIEAESLCSYLKTDIVRDLVLLRKNSQHINKTTFKYVPIVPLDRIWCNDSIREYFNYNYKISV